MDKIFKSVDSSVSMADLQYGSSSTGVEEYLSALKSIAVEQAGQQVLDIQEIINTCDQNWSGQAKENFKANLNNDANHVSEQFSKLYSVLEDEIRAAASAMYQKDRTMLESDAYNAGAATSAFISGAINNQISTNSNIVQGVSNATLGNAANAAYAAQDYLEGTNSPLAQPAAAIAGAAGNMASGANTAVNNAAEWAEDVATDAVNFFTGNN
jgi:uncharacterized protein YukE